jgi:hypothetical protein
MLAALGVEELTPGRAYSAPHGAHPGAREQPPDAGSRDRDAQLGELAAVPANEYWHMSSTSSGQGAPRLTSTAS